MKCPTCANIDLVMSERQGVEIDYCPTCRGIWLDRGELDKIIEKANLAEKGGSFNQHNQTNYKRHDSDDFYKHRKKHWLNELFD